ncbi:hypothetical protein OF83DRAFT_1275377 [Amylostereum chailletii]|nr:hypothetical protein OF83DRAFT_1275377 [Amylostereum chailletii]
MESTHELQQQEITALKSIYAEDFIECQPRAWKGAVRLPEFKIKVPHPDDRHATKVYVHLHTIFPKTYPTNAYPTFSLQQPIQGLTSQQVSKLSHAIHAEVKQYMGTEMVFQIVTFLQDWISSNVTPPIEVVGSLATEMTRRALDEERAKREREEVEAAEAAERERRVAEEFNEEMLADAQRQQVEREKHRARQRARSDATEVPTSPGLEDIITQGFDAEIEIDGIHFSSVKLFHPKQDPLGVIYQADPLCDDINATLPLEVLVVTFSTPYYSTSQGRKKLKQLETELVKHTKIRNPGVARVYAVKLSLHYSSGPARLAILMEQRPTLTMWDLLEECDVLRHERAQEYIEQLLLALHDVHAADLVHRGITLHTVGLVNGINGQRSAKRIKLFHTNYYVRLLDLHRSNPFGADIPATVRDLYRLPDNWLAKDAVDSSLVYTRSRDIHCVGVMWLQMILRSSVVHDRRDVNSALSISSPSLNSIVTRAVTTMCLGKKSNVSCLSVLEEIKYETRAVDAPMSSPVMIPDLKTPRPLSYGSSPEIDYFYQSPPRPRHASRWKEDWEQLELLGRGAFGSVVKARNKIDSRIYAVKKVQLKATKRDSKIFREVNALSRLSHRFIVRYYTTWVESNEPSSASGSDEDDSGDETDTAERFTSARGIRRKKSSRMRRDGSSDDPFATNFDDAGSGSRNSFPSIHFSHENKTEDSDGDADVSSDEMMDDLLDMDVPGTPAMQVVPRQPAPLSLSRTLYIQMVRSTLFLGIGNCELIGTSGQEFVERQTLKERIAEGLAEDEAWRLFHQILDALVHMSSLGILHRDIKLTNIFIDGKGDCKVGDFGLATSSLAAVDPSDVAPQAMMVEWDMTLEVGTKLYIAPEVQSFKKGLRYHTKADMYSLGVVFFEMNHFFSTGSERIVVLEDLRKPGIFFPQDWDASRTRQRTIITSLLQHNPEDRPTALELSQSNMLPPRMEDEYFRGALKMMVKPDSPHHQAVLSALFGQHSKGVRGLLYDHEVDHAEHASLNGVVRDALAAIFRLHGAIEMEPPLLMPLMDSEDETNRAIMLDRHGEVVSLPNNGLLPFARLAARTNLQRIKRFHIGDIFRPNPVAGHPRVSKAAMFDIITTDVANGMAVSTAEAIIIVNECLDSFPSLSQQYEIRISHSCIIDAALNRVPVEMRSAVVDVITQTKSSWPQKRAMLLKKGLLKSVVDELEVLEDTDDAMDVLIARLAKVSPSLLSTITPAIDDMKKVIQYTNISGVTRPIVFHPLMIGGHNAYFKEGVCFEVVKRNKRGDILAAGGRYDNLISQFSAPKQSKGETSLCSVGVQISLEKILVALVAYQAISVKSFLKEQRSFGFWSPRRCDVYILSQQPEQLSERLEVAALLWRHNISCDIMYESALIDGGQEDYFELCVREGILFSLWPRSRSARRDQPAFKVKSILRSTEYELSRQELVPWLQQQIAEQKRVDTTTSGAPVLAETSQGPISSKDPGNNPDVQLVLPGDAKKQRKQTKQLFMDKAFEMGVQVQAAAQSGIPVISVDLPASTFELMCKSSTWVTDDDAWKLIAAAFPLPHTGYSAQVRDAVLRRRTDGHRFILLFAVRDERVHLLTLS